MAEESDETGKRKKKRSLLSKGKDYAFEFFMLFLAVTLGFLVDNWRQSRDDSSREKQLIQSLVNDLTADTARLNSIIESRNIRDSLLDKLLDSLNSSTPEKYTNSIYTISSLIPRFAILQFMSNDGTIQELKNGSGLTLIQKRLITDSIMHYDSSIRLLTRFNDVEWSVMDAFRLSAHKVLIWEGLSLTSGDNHEPLAVTTEPPLAPGYKQYLNEFSSRALSARNVNKGYRRECRTLLTQAENLIAQLKKEYSID